MQFDTLSAFAPVSLLLRACPMVVTPSYEVKTVADLITLGQPDQKSHVYFASAGPGSAQHLAGELFNLLAKTQLQHVAWGRRPGHDRRHVRPGAGHVRQHGLGLATREERQAARRRAGRLDPLAGRPDLPTIAESGVPGYETYEWNAVFAPAGTPPEVVTQLSQALARC